MSKQSLPHRLWRARVEGSSIDYCEELPADEAAAYRIQREVTSLTEWPIIGYKLGATGVDALETVGLNQPFLAPLFANFTRPTGSNLLVPPSQQWQVEVEIAVGLRQALPPRVNDYTYEEICEAVAWLSPALELVATRLRIEVPGNGLLLIADGGINAALVLGEKTARSDEEGLSQLPATLEINGRVAVEGHFDTSVFASPFAAVAWLANHSVNQGRGLHAGDVIATGTCTGMTRVAGGDHVVGRIDSLGEVKINLNEAAED